MLVDQFEEILQSLVNLEFSVLKFSSTSFLLLLIICLHEWQTSKGQLTQFQKMCPLARTSPLIEVELSFIRDSQPWNAMEVISAV